MICLSYFFSIWFPVPTILPWDSSVIDLAGSISHMPLSFWLASWIFKYSLLIEIKRYDIGINIQASLPRQRRLKHSVSPGKQDNIHKCLCKANISLIHRTIRKRRKCSTIKSSSLCYYSLSQLGIVLVFCGIVFLISFMWFLACYLLRLAFDRFNWSSLFRIFIIWVLDLSNDSFYI